MSEECCSQTKNSLTANCPVNGNKGKRVQTITLKSLLTPRALETLNPESNYFFCDSINCSVVYFNQQGQTFFTDEVKVPVFQKDMGGQVPVCYCFDWTRDRLSQEIQQTNYSTAESSNRVAIFGSARIKPEDSEYIDVFNIARGLAESGFDLKSV